MRREANLLARFGWNLAGNFSTMTAVFAPVLISLGAVAVDAASLYVERRQAQSLADLAAITAAANIGKAETAVLRTLSDNGVVASLSPTLPADAGAPAVTVATGRYDPDSGIAANARFVAGATPANAVQVRYARTGARFFAGGLIPAPRISVTALASQTPKAAFSVGTRLASLSGGIANAMLGALLGANVSLSVADYNALLATDVSVFSFLDALAIESGLTVATYDQVLNADLTVGDIAAALAKTDGVSGSAKFFLQDVAASAGSATLDVPLAHVIGLGDAGHLMTGNAGGGLSASAGVLELLSASAAIANGSRQLALGLGLGVPGIASLTLDFATGEPPVQSPWFTLGEKGAMVRTAQSRLLLSLDILGPGGLIGASVKLPVFVELASAEATLANVACPSGAAASATVTIDAKPSAADIRIASYDPAAMADFTRTPVFAPATLVKAPLVTIKGQARVSIANPAAKPVSFSATEIAAHAVKSVSTTSAVASITASLIDDLHLTITVAGLGIGLPGLATAALSATLQPVAPAIDTVLFSVLSVLGVKIGEADIRVSGVDCGRPALVQ